MGKFEARKRPRGPQFETNPEVIEQEQTELTESFLKSSVSSVTSCEEVTSGETGIMEWWNDADWIIGVME